MRFDINDKVISDTRVFEKGLVSSFNKESIEIFEKRFNERVKANCIDE